jgi:hypothetical protein
MTKSRWGQVVISLSLIGISALCLLKFTGWAATYSGLYGLPSQTRIIPLAHQRSLIYFFAGMLAEAILIINLMLSLKFDFTERAQSLKFLARGITSFAIAAVGTLSAAWLLSSTGKLLR